ncbi:MAG: hypothetical protein QM723_18385 [Myxococcaceae bacterium]
MFDNAGEHGARDVRTMGVARAQLITVEGWRMSAFVHWQVLGESAARLRDRWPGFVPKHNNVKHADQAITDSMDTVRAHLKLPVRPPSRAGRRRKEH